MAWLDDRAWCHPKLTELTDKQFRVYVNGLAYSSGMGTRGSLSAAQQKLLGSNAATRTALIAAGLWDEQVDGGVYIHSWDEHNAKRDARRDKDRERKRAARSGKHTPACPQDSPQDVPRGQSTGTSAGTARVETVETVETDDKQAEELPLRLVTEAASKARPRDLLWDAVEQVCGPVGPKSERAIRNRKVKELRDHGATPEEVIRRAALIRIRFPNVDLTDQSLVRHWSKADLPLPQGSPLQRKEDISDRQRGHTEAFYRDHGWKYGLGDAPGSEHADPQALELPAGSVYEEAS